jgi:hypothetical protein
MRSAMTFRELKRKRGLTWDRSARNLASVTCCWSSASRLRRSTASPLHMEGIEAIARLPGDRAEIVQIVDHGSTHTRAEITSISCATGFDRLAPTR